ncbi:MAG: class I SAM-dependent methyltransferase [Bacteroidetes bacterium]|nr:class I SAM-dependent methyltransferase [Bacteroidota bacterium]
MPQAFFNNYALEYDAHFSETLVGRAQRQLVHNYLDKVILPEMSVLEINCGTGVDALFLAERCSDLLCTDLSEKMVEVTKHKTQLLENCMVKQASIQDLDKAVNKITQVIFSNFGGLNCLDKPEILNFTKTCSALTQSGSQMVFVIMGTKCIWENFYFILKGDFTKAFRRKQNEGVKTGSAQEEFIVQYYTPGEIKDFFKTDFICMNTKPIGLFLPPSYLNSFFKNRPLLFSFFSGLDQLFSRFSFFSNYADHYLIHLERK